MQRATIEELSQRVDEARLARELLGSDAWIKLLKPMLDSMVKGLIDIREITISSEQKASIELKSRKLAAEYVESIPHLLGAYINDGEVAQSLLTPPQQRDPLVKDRDQDHL